MPDPIPLPSPPQDPGPNDGPGDPIVIPSRAEMSRAPALTPSGELQSYGPGEFRFQPRVGQDNYLLRAQDQGFWESSGKRLLNLVPNIAGGLLEDVGWLGSLVDSGDDRDYRNWLTDLGKKLKNPAGEVYREHPDRVIDWADPAFYGDSLFSLVESVAPFALEGAGLAKIAGLAPKLGEALKVSRGIQLALKGAAELGTASTLSFVEGAQMGEQVYNKTLQTQYDRLRLSGMSAEDAGQEAKHRASQAAAATVQLNTIGATLLNLSMIHPLFQTESDIMRMAKKELTREPGETMSDWAARIKDYTPDQINRIVNPRRKFLTSYAGEALQEGFEEGFINQSAQKRGEQRGQEGKSMAGIGDLLSDFSHLLDDGMDADGALNFALGALGGVGQTVILDHIPMNYQAVRDENGDPVKKTLDGQVVTGPDGQPKFEKRLYSGHQQNVMGATQLFKGVRDMLVGDVNRIRELQDKMEEAKAAGDPLGAMQAQSTLFNSGMISTIGLGITDPWIKQYQQIAAIDNTKPISETYQAKMDAIDQQLADPNMDEGDKKKLMEDKQDLVDQVQKFGGMTEAMKRGLAASPKDNAYKEKAQRAIEDLKFYDKTYKKLQAAAGDSDSEKQYADYMFSKIVNIRGRENNIKDYEQSLQAQEQLLNGLLPAETDQVTTDAIRSFMGARTAYQAIIGDAKSIKAALEDIDAPDAKRKAQAIQTLRQMAETYLPNGVDERNLPDIARKVLPVLSDKVAELDDSARKHLDTIEASPAYQEYKEKNPKGDSLDFLSRGEARSEATKELSSKRGYLEKYKQQLDVAKMFFQELQSARGKQKFIKDAGDYTGRLAKEMDMQVKLSNDASTQALFSKKSGRDIADVQRGQIIRAAQDRLTELESQRDQLAQQAYDLSLQQKDILKRMGQLGAIVSRTYKANSLAIQSLMGQIEQMENVMGTIQDRLDEWGDIPAGEPITNTDSVHGEVPGPLPVKDVEVTPDPLAILRDMAYDTSVKTRTIMVLNDLAADLEDGITDQIPLNYLADNGLVGPGLLTQADATLLMQSFSNQNKAYIKEVKKTEEFVKEKPESPIQSPSPKTITPEAEELLATIQQGGVPSFISKKLEKIAADNGIEITGQTTPNDIINQLKVKRDTAPKPPLPENPDTPGIGITLDNIQGPEAPDSDPGGNPPVDIDTARDVSKSMEHGNDPVIDAFKVNQLTHAYTELTKGNKYLISSTGALNPDVPQVFIQHGGVVTGDEVSFQVDTEWQGTVNANQFTPGAPGQVADSFGQYSVGDNKVRIEDQNAIDEFPIKIVHKKSGETIGYVPRISWINAQYAGATNYRNVADEVYQNGQLVATNNVATQTQALRIFRKKVALFHNQGALPIATRVNKRQNGTPVYTESKYLTTQMPDPKLRFGLARAGVVSDAAGSTLPGVENVPEVNEAARVGVLLPAPNGKTIFQPIWSDKLGKRGVDAVARALEIYMTVDSDLSTTTKAVANARTEAQQILKETGFDLTTVAGLKGFINQYYDYTRGFPDEATTANAAILPGETRAMEFMLSVANTPPANKRKAIIKAGIRFSGQAPAYAQLDRDGNLSQGFKNLLYSEQGMAGRIRNVTKGKPELGIRGINDLGEIREMVYHPQTRNWSSTSHASYNDMVKSFTQSFVKGDIQAKDGSYVYFANPATYLDYTQAVATQLLAEPKVEPLLATPKGTQTIQAAADKVEPNLNNSLVPPMRSAWGLGNSIYIHTTRKAVYEFRLVEGSPYPQTDIRAWEANRLNVETGLYNQPITPKQMQGVWGILQRDHPNLIDQSIVSSPKPTVTPQLPGLEDLDPADLSRLDKLDDGMPSALSPDLGPEVPINMVGNSQGQELSLDNLEKLYNFTPAEHRNGRQPGEVLEDLKGKGIIQLTPGFNPFYGC